MDQPCVTRIRNLTLTIDPKGSKAVRPKAEFKASGSTAKSVSKASRTDGLPPAKTPRMQRNMSPAQTSRSRNRNYKSADTIDDSDDLDHEFRQYV